MVIAPIYRDTIFTYSGDTLTYSISLNGQIIFNGRAYAAPGEDTIGININRICENYVNNYAVESLLTGVSEEEINPLAYRQFSLLNESGTTLETFNFLYNYDYNGSFNTSGMTLSEPITDGNHFNLFHINTVWNGTQVINNLSSTAYTRDICNAEYALYYLNAKGGWDALVIEGSAQKSDKVSRHQYNKVFNNQTVEYEKNTYISEINTDWKLTTGILDDEQARKLCWHLLSSNRVYLHDLKSDKIVPVVITNTNNIYHTYRNNDHQPIQYVIELTESQIKLRQ